MRRHPKQLMILLSVALGTLAGCRPPTPDVAFDQPIAGKLRGRVTYTVTLNAGDYLTLRLGKESTGIALSLLRPNGSSLRVLPCTDDGPATLTENAEISGRYEIQLRACQPPSNGMPYELQLSSNPATAEATELLQTEHLSSTADQLVAQYNSRARETAVANYAQASTRWIALGNHEQASKALSSIAELERDRGNIPQALKNAEGAQAEAVEAHSKRREAEALLNLASINDLGGNTAQALIDAGNALKIGQSAEDRKVQQDAQYLLGRVSYDINNYAQASAAFRESREIAQRRSDLLGAARAGLYLAAVDFDQQRFESALATGREALVVFQSFGDKKAEAMASTYLGHFHSAIGQKQQAQDIYMRARTLLADSGDYFVEASLFNGLGHIYLELGDAAGALGFLELALDRNKALKDHIGMAWSALWIGESHYLLGHYPDAMKSFNESLATFRSLASRKMEATLLQDIGVVLNASGARTAALAQLRRSQQISREIQDRRLEAWTVLGIGHVLEGSGKIREAVENYQRALEFYKATQDVSGHITASYRIAACLSRMGRLAEAKTYAETALDLIERFRVSVVNQGLRTSYLSSMREQYDLYIDVLMQLNKQTANPAFAALAFEASERSRARSLLDSISKTEVSITEGVDPNQVQRAGILKSQLATQSDQYTRLLSTNANTAAISDARTRLEQLTRESDILEGNMRQQSPRYAALTQPQPLPLERIQRELLDDNSLLLEYFVGEQSSYVWAVTRNAATSYQLPKRLVIESKVLRLRRLMTARIAATGDDPAGFIARVRKADDQYADAVADLARVLLNPVTQELGKEHLIVVAEGVLQSVPFAALPTPGRNTPLVMDHEVVNLPSAAILSVLRGERQRRRKPDLTVAVFADPVFQQQDSRVSAGALAKQPAPQTSSLIRGDEASALGSLPRLAKTQEEARAILDMVPTESRFAALGFAATKEAAMAPDLSRYRILHFATHTVLFDDHPDLSSLVMSLVDAQGRPRNGLLRLRDVYNLKLSAELVVLSACETATGKEVKGEGLMSMVRGFMYSGTPRVLASLWKVDDFATAELMKEFYAQLLQHGRTPAAALRQAQLTLRARRSTAAPYYWAGFELHGDWR